MRTGLRAQPRILVTGSRDWPAELTSTVAHTLYTVGSKLAGRPVGPGFPAWKATLVHGAADGADLLCEQVALNLGWDVEAYPVRNSGTMFSWGEHGRKAGILRNQYMLNLGADVCCAFRYNGSRGTTHMIDYIEAFSTIPLVLVDIRSHL